MQADHERRIRADGSRAPADARQPRTWRVRLLCGDMQLPGRGLPAAHQTRRLVGLVATMVVVSGMLMALDAPRTLGLYLLLLGGVEGLLLAAWVFLRALQWWRGRCRGRLGAGRAARGRAWAVRPLASLGVSRRRGGSRRPEVDWRVLEAAWLFLLLLWFGVRS